MLYFIKKLFPDLKKIISLSFSCYVIVYDTHKIPKTLLRFINNLTLPPISKISQIEGNGLKC